MYDTGSQPLFPFGHGLSYTTFDVADGRLAVTDIDATGTITVETTVTNTRHPKRRRGRAALRPPAGARRRAARAGARRVRPRQTEPGASADMRFDVPMSVLAHTGVDRILGVEAAPVELRLGTSSTDIRWTATVEVTSERLVLDRAQRAFFSEFTLGERRVAGDA